MEGSTGTETAAGGGVREIVLGLIFDLCWRVDLTGSNNPGRRKVLLALECRGISPTRGMPRELLL